MARARLVAGRPPSSDQSRKTLIATFAHWPPCGEPPARGYMFALSALAAAVSRELH